MTETPAGTDRPMGQEPRFGAKRRSETHGAWVDARTTGRFDDDMKCPKCGIEMQRKAEGEWVCRNPRCTESRKGGTKK